MLNVTGEVGQARPCLCTVPEEQQKTSTAKDAEPHDPALNPDAATN